MAEHFFGYGRWDALYWFIGPEAAMDNDGIDSVPAYAMFNLNFQFFKNGTPWQLELAIDNVTNAAGVAAKFVDAFGTATDAGGRGVVTDQYIPPRQVIASIHYKF